MRNSDALDILYYRFKLAASNKHVTNHARRVTVRWLRPLDWVIIHAEVSRTKVRNIDTKGLYYIIYQVYTIAYVQLMSI